MPRPPKSENERLSCTICLRLKAADYSAWIEKVEESGMTASEFFRQAIILNRTRVQAKRLPTQEKRDLVFLVGKISNNVNQLAHRANEDNLKGIVTEATYRDIFEVLSKIMAILKREVDNAH